MANFALGPTGYGNSPYMCFSAFGGNALLISPEKLIEEGYLESSELGPAQSWLRDHVDYGAVLYYKFPLLKKSFQRFKARPYPKDFYEFCDLNAFWLEDYALFMALKSVHEWRVWTDWDSGAARRDTDSLARWRNKLSDRIQFQKYLEYIFFKQRVALKNYCHQNSVQIIGDIPIYVAHDSAEVWANRQLFYLDEQGEPFVVAGVPPDYFSATGQRWGNPIYHWDFMAQSGYEWWINRFRANYALVDIVRLDHFRGFEAY